MSDRCKPFMADEAGSELVEWIVVTLILTVAIYALLQAIGPEINDLLMAVLTWIRG